MNGILKRTALLLVAVMLMAVAAGCGGGAAANTPTPTPTATMVNIDDEVVPGGDRLANIIGTGVINMVTSPDFPPYEFIDPSKSGQEQYVGMDLALAKYIADELGVELHVEAMDFDTVLVALANGQCDMGLAGLSPREDRKETMDFSDIYYEGNQVIMIRAEDKDKYKTIDDLAGKTVGAQNASEQQKIVEEQLPDSALQLFKKVPDEILALQSGTVEAVAMEGPVAQGYAQNNPDVIISEIAVEGETAGTAVALPKGEASDTLLQEINRIIAKAKDEGLIDQWKQEAMDLNASLNE